MGIPTAVQDRRIPILVFKWWKELVEDSYRESQTSQFKTRDSRDRQSRIVDQVPVSALKRGTPRLASRGDGSIVAQPKIGWT